jgi:O-antigen/teichoic acid export membrane protein
VVLVVVLGKGARGLLLGNYAASTVVLFALWFKLRHQLWGRRGRPQHAEEMGALLRFGLPTVPAEASVYALSIVDRYYIFHHRGPAQAGLYSIAVKLAGAVAFIVRGFQYAWPPLAYSIESDAEASKLYSLVTTYFVLATGVVVAAVALVGRWIVRLLAAPQYFGAHAALPWLALAWTLYGVYQVMIVITGRARVTSRNLPAAAAGLVVNVVLLLVLVPNGGLGLGIAGAGIALCGAYVAMLIVMHLLTRRLFVVGFEWLRLAQLAAIFTAVAVSGELLLPTSGFAGIALRILWLALIPVLLLLTRFFRADERSQARALVADGRRRAAAFRRGHGEVEEYAEDPLKDL